jgi:general secretion pathway protein M
MAGPAKAAAPAALQRAWQGLAPRERQWVLAAAALLGALLLWLLAVQPAWRTLASAPARIDRLDAEWADMQRLARETQALRGAPPLALPQAQAALRAATERLGEKASVQLTGERAVVTVNSLAPGVLRDWLAELRAGARARPVLVQLQKSGEGFSGRIELALPGAEP